LPFGKVDGHEVSRAEAQSLLDRQRNGPTPIGQLNPDVDEQLAGIIHSCLQFDPGKRPQTADALCESLGRYLSGWSSLRRGLRRHRVAVSCAALATAVLLAAWGVWLAMRPPFQVRAYESGLVSYERGDMPAAIASFSAALDHSEPTPDLYFARGMARLRQQDVPSAISDFRAAEQLAPSGVIYATLAYCHGLRMDYRNAKYYGKQAIAAGFKSAEVYNNLGRSHLELNELEHAKDVLDRAIEVDNQLAEAYLNRAKVGLYLAYRDKRVPVAAKEDIDRALSLDTDTPEVFFDAARIYALAAKTNLAFQTDVRHFLVQAIERGFSADAIQKSPFLAEYCKTPWFRSLVRKSPVAAETRPNPPVIPPSVIARLK
jgi:tetratricopeptide (TPR) repeat protein